jgi:hypothetical protein
MAKPIAHLLPFCTLLVCLVGAIHPATAQISDTLFPLAFANPDPNLHSPFKDLSILRASANGHKESGTVEVAMVVTNQSYKIASLIFSINPVLSKAADDLDSLYSINQLRFGASRRDSTSVVSIQLRPNQMLHFGLYINNVPLDARYIRKVVLLTSLTLDQVSMGQDNIILTDLKIDWK